MCESDQPLKKVQLSQKIIAQREELNKQIADINTCQTKELQQIEWREGRREGGGGSTRPKFNSSRLYCGI